MVSPGPSGRDELSSPGLMRSAAARNAAKNASEAAGRILAGWTGMDHLLLLAAAGVTEELFYMLVFVSPPPPPATFCSARFNSRSC